MDDGLKQRLIGALVLIALALVFLPTLFHRDQRVPVDQVSQLPGKPVFEPVIIAEPTKPEVAQQRPINEVFQPAIEAPVVAPTVPASTPDSEINPVTEAKLDVKPETDKQAKPAVKPKENDDAQVTVKAEVAELPGLNSSGVTKSWVLQVASFKDQKRAEAFSKTLIDKGYRAFVKTSTIASGKVSRTFVGPHIDKKSALTLKKQLDVDMKINSLVVEFAP